VKPKIKLHREVWTKEEEQKAIRLWNQNKTAKEIASILGRSFDSTYKKIQRLRK
jgi:DNA-binding CsgD family transcriptional regulator